MLEIQIKSSFGSKSYVAPRQQLVLLTHQFVQFLSNSFTQSIYLRNDKLPSKDYYGGSYRGKEANIHMVYASNPQIFILHSLVRNWDIKCLFSLPSKLRNF